MKSLRSFRMFFVALALMLVPAASFAGVLISVGIAPPPLPIYEQPVAPGDGYLWMPGYWAYGPGGYYWVPGVWVEPPMVGELWTPGYWGWGGNAFLWNEGYWGPHVGFYGGINYGFGYGGVGFEGGYWNNGAFQYNRAVMNVGGNVHNVYSRNVTAANNNFAHTSFNGGNGGVPARASAPELAAAREQHRAPTANQVQHQTAASQNRAQFASANGGHPAMAAQSRVGDTAHAVPAAGAPRNAAQAPRAAPQAAPRQAPQAAPRPAPQAAPRPAPQAAPRQAPQAAPRQAPQAAPRQAPQAAPRQAPQAAPRPAPQPAPRPAPQAAPRPAPQARP